MARIIFVSGPCGCGKTTFTNAYARHLVSRDKRPIYVIHGDDFHRGYAEPENREAFFAEVNPADFVQWADILRFNWDCIISTADRALKDDLDVIIDYVIEDELPRVRELAKSHGAKLYYIVLTAQENELRRRITQRGDPDLIERSIFLKQKLESRPENLGHLLDNTDKTTGDLIHSIVLDKYRVE